MQYALYRQGEVKGGSVVACAGHATYGYGNNRGYIGYSKVRKIRVLRGPKIGVFFSLLLYCIYYLAITIYVSRGIQLASKRWTSCERKFWS